MVTRTTILATLLLVTFYSQGQSYDFRHFQVENGLSNNAVICSIQDKQGFLWFGTKDGLDRFDGYSFKIFRNDPDIPGSIGSNFIHSLYEDQQQTLWVGTENGLYRYDAATESFKLLPTPGNMGVRELQMDKQGNLWFITAFTLCKYDGRRDKLQTFPSADYFEATSIYASADGGVWVSTPLGVIKKYKAADNTFTEYNVFEHSPKTASTWIEKLYGLSNGKLLVGTSNQGAKLFDPVTLSYQDILTYNPDKTDIFARNFIQTSDDECWIATESGIYIYNIRSGNTINLRKKYNDPYSLSDNAVYAFCKDNEGGIWAGTYFGGVNYYPNQSLSFTKYFPKTAENSISGHVVREIHEDNAGNLWIGTEDAGLNKWETSTGLFTNFRPTGSNNSISYTNIHGLLVNGDELWIGTFEHGLDVMSIKTGKVIRHYSKGAGEHMLKSNFIYCITRSKKGDIMLGTTVGAYLYNPSKDDFSLLPGMPLHNWYSSILEDANGMIWAGTYGNGVNYYDPSTGKSINFRYSPQDKQSLSSDRVNGIFEDSQHNLWFATEGGLCLFEPATRTFKRYTGNNGLPSDFILSLLEDSRRNLWITTSKGLVRFNPASGQMITYTRAAGILNDQFNFSSAFKDRQGNLYFGSVKGLIRFHPDEDTPRISKPVVYITGFQVDNKDLVISAKNSPLEKSISFTNKIVLTHHQSTFSIDFASLNYTSPEMTEYAYRMEGLDKDWTYLKANRKVYFTDLSPGTYVFRVKASNNPGVWADLDSQLQIEILPPWWASRWAYFIYGITAILLVVLIVRNYHQRVRMKNSREIEQLEIVKEKELFEAKINFFTDVAHEIRTPLTLIKGPLEKIIRKAGGNPEIKDSLRIMEKNTNRLVELTSQLLDFRQTEIRGFSLNFAQVNIVEMLEDIWLSFKPLAEQKDLAFTLRIPAGELSASLDSDAFNKILTNLFSNAVKYPSRQVVVEMLPHPGDATFFTIEFRNDGYLIPYEMKDKIFEPFFRLRETEKMKGTGIGLALARSLTLLHKGQLELKESNNDMNIFALSMPVSQDGVLPEHKEPTETEQIA